MTLKPRVGFRELEMEPSEAEYMSCCRVESNASGSLDICDQYVQVVHTSKVWASRKSVARRFVPGNTASKRMAGLPMLQVAQMATATVSEREALLFFSILFFRFFNLLKLVLSFSGHLSGRHRHGPLVAQQEGRRRSRR